MALKICHLFDAGSSEPEPESDTRSLSDHDRGLKQKITKKSEELKNASLEEIHLNHHLRNAKEAIKAGKPPLGLTPKLNLTVYRRTKELQDAVDAEMKKSWSSSMWPDTISLQTH